MKKRVTLSEDEFYPGQQSIDIYHRHKDDIALMAEMGYTPWGCTDLVFASSGEMSKRYGFIYADRDGQDNDTRDRARKKYFYWYKKVIASNGCSLD